jgi:hypothetical protein
MNKLLQRNCSLEAALRKMDAPYNWGAKAPCRLDKHDRALGELVEKPPALRSTQNKQLVKPQTNLYRFHLLFLEKFLISVYHGIPVPTGIFGPSEENRLSPLGRKYNPILPSL